MLPFRQVEGQFALRLRTERRLAYKEQISAPALSSRLKRVLIVDPNPLSVSIMTDLIQQVGSVRVF